ncbi:MAG: hypothetical protein HQK99_13975 [Nitrospirae bacterium]|nr:hypothetical protein [Nitrospirota bacterium]
MAHVKHLEESGHEIITPPHNPGMQRQSTQNYLNKTSTADMPSKDRHIFKEFIYD